MLSRRHLRVKVLQALYAFFQSDGDDIAVGEKQLINSTDKLYELYIYQISFLIKLVDYTRNQILTQASTAMLAQANMRGQSVLQLLQ